MCDCYELVTALRCCAENQCEICPRGDTQYGWIECKKKLTHDVTDAIEELVARKTAFWVDTQPHMDDSDYKKDGMSYYCSNCHHRAGKYKHRTYKFCPWCGAAIMPKEDAE